MFQLMDLAIRPRPADELQAAPLLDEVSWEVRAEFAYPDASGRAHS
jgi:hypothetical protein